MNVYFYFGKAPANNQIFHSCVCLAEGFMHLGIKSFGDFSHAQVGVGKDFLIESDPQFGLNDSDIVFIHYSIYDRMDDADTIL